MNDLLTFEKIANKNAVNVYCPLDQNLSMPLINIPSISFSKLSFFSTTSPSNNQLIYYNNSAGLWENTQINSSFVNDFNIISPTSNQMLQYLSGK